MKPFLSVILLVTVSLGFLVLKMEVVRTSYELVRMGRQLKLAKQEQSIVEARYAKLTRPQRLDQIATQRLLLSRVQKNQVILMAANRNLAVRQ
jgi:hypothetical protein